jgi:UDP-N-acetylmuramoylalanine--D-glutamate ligase
VGRPRPPLPPGPYLVVGLARSGLAAALVLRARGEEVIGIDSGDARSQALQEASRRLSQAGVEVHLDASGDALAARAGTLIKSPGVPQHEPTVVAARARGIPVLGELELAWRLLGHEFVAVTGTNGKTTTVEWIGHIHRQAGWPVEVVGNVGTAASSLVGGNLPNETTIVCEASSFQLEDTESFAPEAAALLNLSEDHLDRHTDYADYVSAKLRIFAHQTPEDVAILPQGLELEIGGQARQVRFGAGPEVELARHTLLPGEHNRQNAMAAAAVCLARGIDPEAIAAGVRSFTGVAHRLELIATVDGVAWVNDSKATNVQSTLVALRAFERGVHLIAGGTPKDQDFSSLAPLVSERCTAVYLIGEAAGQINQALQGLSVPVDIAGELGRAVQAARRNAQPGDTVLLSPACASFDQYGNFEERGTNFRRLVEEL